jgi:hypothetical protein
LGYLTPPPSPQPVVVYKDVGGLVTDYEAQTEIYRRENREVRLHECRSACTLALSLPNVCVFPDAQVKFHQAYNALTRETDLGVSSKLFDSYPEAVQKRLGYLTRQYKVLSGVELIALGVRNCQHDDRLMIAAKKPPAQASVAAAPQEANPLRDLARKVTVAVAGALERQNDASPAPVVLPDRSPVPPALARLAAEAELRDIPLPPRRPALLTASAEDLAIPDAPRLIEGAQPILDASRFVPPPPSQRAEAQQSPTKAGG